MIVECSFEARIEAIGRNKPIVKANFLVVKEGKRSLLGRGTASDMELLQIDKKSAQLRKRPNLPEDARCQNQI